MGVDLKVMTIFGVDNFTGDVDEDSFCGENVYIPQDKIVEHPLTLAFVKDYCFDRTRNEWKWYPDVLYFGRYNEEGQGIAGLKLSYHYGRRESRTFRALAMLYPEFMQSGYRDVPLESSDMLEMEFRYARERPSCGDIEFRDKWFYPQGYWKLAPQWAFVTRWLFNSVGIETNVDDYKWMLVWEWS